MQILSARLIPWIDRSLIATTTALTAKFLAGVVGALLIFAAIWATEVLAESLFVTNGYQFLDNASPNSIGLTAGERQQLGSTCVVLTGNPCTPQNLANAVGTSGSATQGAVTLTLNFVASDLASNHWATSRAPSAIPDGQWTLNFSNGPDQASTTTPNLTGAVQLGFAQGTSISPNGSTPTFGWIFPNLAPGSSIDAVSINIRDVTDIRNGISTIIYRNGGLPASTTSFSILPNDPHFIGGHTLVPGRQYSLEIQLQDTRNNLAQGAFTNVLSQSRTFINFSVADGSTLGKIYLPMIDTSGPVPVYRFAGIPVEAGEMIFIDPVVAIGFDYQTAPGDPNFRSVLLPTGVGDNLFDLWLWNGVDWFDTDTDLLGGQEFLFGLDGVDRFRITGIEIEEFLDPFGAGGFTTGVSFVGDGQFNGTMTPLIVTVQVPEPGSLALLALGLLGFGFARRRKPR